jgi:NADPH:quinone reductase-like Zn-dependent oxidoreductase
MRALYLERVGLPAQVREVDDPRLRAAGVVVDVLAVRIPSYTREVFSGELAYDLPVPLAPGPTCVGVVDQVAEDVFHLNRGDVVLCNSFYPSGNADGADDILIG